MLRDDIEKIVELFLEDFQCSTVFPVLDSMLTLYSGGFKTGLVIEIGDSSIRIIPIYRGILINQSIRILELGGSVLSRYTEILLSEIGFTVDNISDL